MATAQIPYARNRASAALRSFCETTGIGALMTFMAKGALDLDDPRCLFTIGMGQRDFPSPVVEDADVILTIGYGKGRVFHTPMGHVGSDVPVHGICVRRNADLQFQRVRAKVDAVLETVGTDMQIEDADIICDDSTLAPGYGMLNDETVNAIKYLARNEGILLDPTYSGKTFAALLGMLEKGEFGSADHVVFLHTGGTPSLFGYPELVDVDQS